MESLPYWNHNTAYYGWVRKRTAPCRSVLDVGCGDGSLLMFLDDGERRLVGLDVDASCICRARERAEGGNATFELASFEDYHPAHSFDAVVFVASIHHMDMRAAIAKAKSLLAPGGLLLVVGVASPSTLADYMVEGLRVLPCRAISAARGMRTSEDENIPVSYAFPTMGEVRRVLSDELPGHSLRYGLYYRYLVEWKKR